MTINSPDGPLLHQCGKPASEGNVFRHSNGAAASGRIMGAADGGRGAHDNLPAREHGTAPLHPLDDVLGHLLGVAKQHHGVVAVEQGIVDTGIA